MIVGKLLVPFKFQSHWISFRIIIWRIWPFQCLNASRFVPFPFPGWSIRKAAPARLVPSLLPPLAVKSSARLPAHTANATRSCARLEADSTAPRQKAADQRRTAGSGRGGEANSLHRAAILIPALQSLANAHLLGHVAATIGPDARRHPARDTATPAAERGGRGQSVPGTSGCRGGFGAGPGAGEAGEGAGWARAEGGDSGGCEGGSGSGDGRGKALRSGSDLCCGLMFVLCFVKAR